jgi:hypothetical protein
MAEEKGKAEEHTTELTNPRVRAAVAAELADIHIKSRDMLRTELDASLKKNIDGVRAGISNEMKARVRDTFTRHVEEFVGIEYRLAQLLNVAFTAHYQGVLSRFKERNISLFQELRSITERVIHDTEKLSSSELKAKLLDIALGLCAIVVPFFYEFMIPDKDTPLLRFVIPLGYLFTILGLGLGTVLTHTSRKSEAGELRDFVKKRFDLVSHMDPLSDESATKSDDLDSLLEEDESLEH